MSQHNEKHIVTRPPADIFGEGVEALQMVVGIRGARAARSGGGLHVQRERESIVHKTRKGEAGGMLGNYHDG